MARVICLLPREELTDLDKAFVSVGLPPTVSRYIVMPRLPGFMRRHPDLKLECRVVRHVKEMHADGFDLLLRFGEPPDSGLIARKVVQHRYAVYAAPDYLKFAGEPTSPDDLARHRCLVFKPPWSMSPLDEWSFERNGERRIIKVRAVLTSDDREALLAMAVAGGGLIQAGMVGPAQIATGRLKRLLSEWTCLGAPALYVLYRKTSRVAPKVAAFLEFVAEAFAAFDPEELTLLHEKGFTGSTLSSRSRSRQ